MSTLKVTGKKTIYRCVTFPMLDSKDTEALLFTIAMSPYDMTQDTVSTHIWTGTDQLLLMRGLGLFKDSSALENQY